MKEQKSVPSTHPSTAQTVRKELTKNTVGCFVAAGVIVFFGLSLLYGFHLVSVLVNASLAYEATERSTAIKDALQILTTIGTLFSPLLAFVLGYYFHQSQEARQQADNSSGSSDTSGAAEKPSDIRENLESTE
jgi:Na+/serine symporter